MKCLFMRCVVCEGAACVYQCARVGAAACAYACLLGVCAYTFASVCWCVC